MRISIGQTYLGKDFQSELNEIRLSDDSGLILKKVFDEKITLNELSSFAKYYSQITDVEIGHCRLLDINFLECFQNITRVSIKTSFLKDISGLSHLTKIRKLSLERPKYRFDILGKLDSLEELYLDDWRPGAESIFNLANLTKIGIQKFGKKDLVETASWSLVKDIWFNAGSLEHLEGAPSSVEKLRLTSLRKLKCLVGLSECKNLKDLRIEGCKSVNTLDGIESNHNLQVLSLVKMGNIANLEPLLTLKNLEYLFIADGTKIETPNIDILNGLPKLSKLVITKTSGLTNKHLYIANPNCETIVTT